MTRTFQLVGLDAAPFEPLFDLSDDELRARGARRCVAGADHGFPCRIGLADARSGDELLLLPWMHQDALSPYRASGPIYVRRGARQRRLAPGEVPPYVTSRLMSLRAYDAEHLIVDAAVCEGTDAGTQLQRLLEDERVRYVHLHNARRGCYSCLALPVDA